MTWFVESAQPEGDGEESGQLETELIGEFHIIHLLRIFSKLGVKDVFVNVE